MKTKMIVSASLSQTEMEQLDAHIRHIRRQTGENVTRSSLLRAMVLATITTPTTTSN